MQDGTPKLAPRIIRSYRHSFVMVHVNVSLKKQIFCVLWMEEDAVCEKIPKSQHLHYLPIN